MRRSFLAGCLLVSLFVVNPSAEPLQRVRVTDPRLGGLIEQGRQRSAAFEQVVSRLEASDWLVFIQSGRCPDRAVVGCLLHMVGSFDGRLYLRVVVRVDACHPDQLIALLAHELQHAAEVVGDGSVRDTNSMIALARRISDGSFKTARATVYETAAARLVQELVSRELLQP